MSSPDLFIQHGTVVPGKGPPMSDQAVLVSGDEIVALGTEAERRAEGRTNLRTIDAAGAFVMPGLVDCHVHMSFDEPEGNDELFFHRTEAFSAIAAAVNAGKVLRAGVTSALDPDSLWNIGVEVRDAIATGLVEGPRLQAGGNALMTAVGGTAGRLISDTGRTGYGVVVRGRQEIVNEVRRQVKHGVDWIKIHITGLLPTKPGREVSVWTIDELKAVVDTAHDLGTPVVGHARNAVSTRDAALAGVDLIYHASYMDEEALDAVVASGATLCPTFTLLGNLADFGDRIGTAPELLDVFRAEIDVTAEMIRRAHEAGVRVVAGSETGFAVTPYGIWHARELEMLVSYMGFSPLQAIEAATRAGAEVLGWADTVGTVEAGKAADLLVVDGDPLADVRVLQDPERLTVVSRGRVIEPALGGERQVRPGQKVRSLATRRLTRELARATKTAATDD